MTASITSIDQRGKVTVSFNYDLIPPKTLGEMYRNKAMNISVKFAYDASYDPEKQLIQNEINKNMTWNVTEFSNR